MYRLVDDSSPSPTFNLCMFFVSLKMPFFRCILVFSSVSGHSLNIFLTPVLSWRYATNFRTLVALETLNTLSKFLVNSSYGC